MQSLVGLSIAVMLLASCGKTDIQKIPLVEVTSPQKSNVEVGFSPEGSAQNLILKTIDSAKQSINLSAYSFTSPIVTRKLIEAMRRGVSVSMVVDYKNNIEDDSSGRAQAALNTLSTAGAKIRLNSNYAIHHDKMMIVDGVTVQSGSFNYSTSANTRNSENVIVVWGDRALASKYKAHWDARFSEGKEFAPTY